MKYLKIVMLTGIVLACKNNQNNVKQEENAVLNKTNQTENNINAVQTSNMVYFKGGTLTVGSNNRTPIESPEITKTIKPFYLDKNLVSVADFRKFIQATNYITEAENYGDAGVFNFKTLQWALVKGVTWEFPLGSNGPKAEDNHPVTQVSWNDAVAYAKWAGKRLPTEFEWEFAAKNGENLKYPWGNEPMVNGKYMANVWNGKTIKDQKSLDGFLYTSPIGHFAPSKSGIFDMVGNVWQWTASTFEPYQNKGNYNINEQVKVIRGGSFMFDEALELSYTTTFRAENTADTSIFNAGFRCAADAK